MTEEPSEFPESSFPKGLSLLFAKREIIDTETIKIPRANPKAILAAFSSTVG